MLCAVARSAEFECNALSLLHRQGRSWAEIVRFVRQRKLSGFFALSLKEQGGGNRRVPCSVSCLHSPGRTKLGLVAGEAAGDE
jgi:hypothetical protein